jgi:hypothetical protein
MLKKKFLAKYKIFFATFIKTNDLIFKQKKLKKKN